jgi:F0F1-type ATP synthase assembly protein I
MQGRCCCCNSTHTLGDAVGGKIACSTLGAILGKAAIANPLGAIACALLGLMVGHFIDRAVVPRCPACGAVLEIIAAVA